MNKTKNRAKEKHVPTWFCLLYGFVPTCVAICRRTEKKKNRVRFIWHLFKHCHSVVTPLSAFDEYLSCIFSVVVLSFRFAIILIIRWEPEKSSAHETNAKRNGEYVNGHCAAQEVNIFGPLVEIWKRQQWQLLKSVMELFRPPSCTGEPKPKQ